MPCFNNGVAGENLLRWARVRAKKLKRHGQNWDLDSWLELLRPRTGWVVLVLHGYKDTLTVEASRDELPPSFSESWYWSELVPPILGHSSATYSDAFLYEITKYLSTVGGHAGWRDGINMTHKSGIGYVSNAW